MNKTVTAVLAFVAGAAIGVVASGSFFKTKYERIANEEIASVKEVYSKRNKKDIPETMEESEEPDEPADPQEMEEYVEMASKYMKKGEPVPKDRPYVISPDDFGERDDFDTVSLTYYADGVLAHDDDTVIEKEDIDEMVGVDSLTHFGEFEDDSVFVRNNEMGIDFEILLDNRNFSDVVGH